MTRSEATITAIGLAKKENFPQNVKWVGQDNFCVDRYKLGDEKDEDHMFIVWQNGQMSEQGDINNNITECGA